MNPIKQAWEVQKAVAIGLMRFLVFAATTLLLLAPVVALGIWLAS